MLHVCPVLLNESNYHDYHYRISATSTASPSYTLQLSKLFVSS